MPDKIVVINNPTASEPLRKAVRFLFRDNGFENITQRCLSFREDDVAVWNFIDTNIGNTSNVVLITTDPMEDQAARSRIIERLGEEAKRLHAKRLFVISKDGQSETVEDLKAVSSGDLSNKAFKTSGAREELSGFLDQVISLIKESNGSSNSSGTNNDSSLNFNRLFKRFLLTKMIQSIDSQERQDYDSTNIDRFCMKTKSLRDLIRSLKEQCSSRAVSTSDQIRPLTKDLLMNAFNETCDFLIQASEELTNGKRKTGEELNEEAIDLRKDILGGFNIEKIKNLKENYNERDQLNHVLEWGLVRYVDKDSLKLEDSIEALMEQQLLPITSPETITPKPITAKRLNRLLFNSLIINVFHNAFRLRLTYPERFSAAQAYDSVAPYLGLDFRNLCNTVDQANDAVEQHSAIEERLAAIKNQKPNYINDYRAYCNLRDAKPVMKKKILEKIFSLDSDELIKLANENEIAKIFFALASEEKFEKVVSGLDIKLRNEESVEAKRYNEALKREKEERKAQLARMKAEAVKLEKLYKENQANIGRRNANCHYFSFESAQSLLDRM